MSSQNAVAGAALLVGVLTVPVSASAQTGQASEAPTTARVMALGGGGHAVGLSTSSLYVNPAAMNLSRVYHADTAALWDPSVGRWSFGGAVVDSTRTVGAGLAYSYSTLDADGGRSSHDVRLGVAITLAEGVTLGLSGRYMNFSGPGSANGRLGVAYSGITLDAGLAVRPWRWLTLGATGYSLTNPDTALAPLSVGGGVAIAPLDELTITGDMVWDLRTFDAPRPRYSGGVEFLAGQVPLRVGYTYDDTRGDRPVHLITGGLGYLDQSFGIEAAVRQEVSGGSQTTLLLNLRYFHRVM